MPTFTMTPDEDRAEFEGHVAFRSPDRRRVWVVPEEHDPLITGKVDFPLVYCYQFTDASASVVSGHRRGPC
jgi:hypothetical protein